MSELPAKPLPAAAAQVGLREIIQLECQQRNSSVLEIYNATALGRIFIHEGKIIHAALDDLKGEPAFQQLLDLPGGEFELVPFENPPEETITTPWPALLNRALRASEQLKTGGDKTSAAAAQRGDSNLVAEIVVCSPAGDLLFAADCADTAARIAWLRAATKIAAEMAALLPLGHFDRMDIDCAASRSLVRHRAGGLVFMQVAKEGSAA